MDTAIGSDREPRTTESVSPRTVMHKQPLKRRSKRQSGRAHGAVREKWVGLQWKNHVQMDDDWWFGTTPADLYSSEGLKPPTRWGFWGKNWWWLYRIPSVKPTDLHGTPRIFHHESGSFPRNFMDSIVMSVYGRVTIVQTAGGWSHCFKSTVENYSSNGHWKRLFHTCSIMFRPFLAFHGF